MKKVLIILTLLIIFLLAFIFLLPKFILFTFLYNGGRYNASKKVASFNNQKITIPAEEKELAGEAAKERILGESNQQKRIEVDLTNQRVYAFEGNNKIYDFAVSTGKWGRTPTGTFRIWTKLRYSLMTGGSTAIGTYYYLPNVPYVMYFSSSEVSPWRGFSLHGTYWHHNFGHPMSHGCINMKTEEAAQIYYWANPDLRGKQSILASPDNPGTEIIIYGTTPAE